MSPTIDLTFNGTIAPDGIVEHIIIKFVLLIPQTDSVLTDVVHRFHDLQEMFEELGGYIFIDFVVFGQFQRDPH
jgi:uncharacterized membrane protein